MLEELSMVISLKEEFCCRRQKSCTFGRLCAILSTTIMSREENPMLNWLKNLVKRYWAPLSYLFFGILTTLVNYAVYLPCYNLFHLSASVSNIVAWVFAVVFAYLTNKPFVFRSHDWSAKPWCLSLPVLWAAGWHPARWKREFFSFLWTCWGRTAMCGKS